MKKLLKNNRGKNMKNTNNIFSILIMAILCLGSIASFSSCRDPEPPIKENVKEYVLTDILDCGTYKNIDESMKDYIVINSDNTISLMDFDGHELATSYAELLKDSKMTEEEFCELLKTPYTTTVYSEDIEDMYKINVPLFGDDSNLMMNFKYNSKDKTILYHRCLYKFESNE